MRIYIFKSDQKWGPFEVAQIPGMLEEGRIVGSDLAAMEGSEDWKPLRQLINLGGKMPPAKSRSILTEIEELEEFLESLPKTASPPCHPQSPRR